MCAYSDIRGQQSCHLRLVTKNDNKTVLTQRANKNVFSALKSGLY